MSRGASLADTTAIARTLSGRGFVAGPLFLQYIAVALQLSGPQISALIELLRCGVEGRHGRSDAALAERLELPPARADALLESIGAGVLLPDSRLRPFDRLRPFFDRLVALAPSIYGAIRKVRDRPRSDEATIATTTCSVERPDLFIVSGFLGSGKTTLVNALLRQPEFAHTIVFINEIGEEAVDHLIVQTMSSPQDILLMRNGCLCCAYGNELIESLRSVLALRAAGKCPPFARVIVETSGVADPGAVVSRIHQDAALRRMVRFRGTATAVDLTVATLDLPRATEARAQISAADWLVLTKADLVDNVSIASAVERLCALNPAATPLIAPTGAVLAGVLLASADAPVFRSMPVSERHDPVVRVMPLRRGAVDPTSFRLFCDLLMLAKADRLYRMKGLLRLVGHEETLLFQAVRGSVHDIEAIEVDAAGTAITIIAPDIDPSSVDELLAILEQRCVERRMS